jgi:hypothetical protein
VILADRIGGVGGPDFFDFFFNIKALFFGPAGANA